MARRDLFTEKSVFADEDDFYSDFDINLSKNPVTGALARLTNEAAVRRSVYNLIKTINGERFWQRKVGSQVYNSLFEPDDDTTDLLLQNTVQDTLDLNEKRVRVLQVLVRRPNIDTIQIDVYAALVSTGLQMLITIPLLHRVR